MRLDHLLSKETHLREILRSVGRTSLEEKFEVLLSFERIILSKTNTYRRDMSVL